MPDLPPAVKTVSQEDAGRPVAENAGAADIFARHDGDAFDIGGGVRRATRAAVYDRRRGDPLYRPLRIYTIDPAEPKGVASQAAVNVPYETVTPGPIGAAFEVIDVRQSPAGAVRYPPLDLNDPRVLMSGGLTPSPTDPRFHQQMVYAVCCTTHAVFRKALGRQLNWGFDRAGTGPTRLTIRPHHSEQANACYDKTAGELQFGYFRAQNKSGRNLPGKFVFTCLSHDIVTHEVTHALLDGLRPHFSHPSGPDALALHEALGDLVALFQRFTFESVVKAAMAESRGAIGAGSLLVEVARQFGDATGRAGPLRAAARAGDSPERNSYDAKLPPHELGGVLVTAIFKAFTTVYARRAQDYVRLATGGTGVLPAGDAPPLLIDFLAAEAGKLAGHFLNVCVRAIDYCPPANVTFGDYLRAMITADHDLVPDDPWGYREALIDGFAERQIYPLDVPTLTEDALLWREPQLRLSPIAALSFSELKFGGDPSRPADAAELARQARVIGRLVTDRRVAAEFGIVFEGDKRLGPGDRVERPCVESVRSSRRVGPDGEVVFDLIAEVTQTRVLERANGGGLRLIGGATLVIGPDGVIRYAIRKNVASQESADRLRDYAGGAGRRFFAGDAANVFALVHAESGRLARH